MSSIKLTEEQMVFIMRNKMISTLTDEAQKQVFDFAFGEDFMDSDDKGNRKTYGANK